MTKDLRAEVKRNYIQESKDLDRRCPRISIEVVRIILVNIKKVSSNLNVFEVKSNTIA